MYLNYQKHRIMYYVIVLLVLCDPLLMLSYNLLIIMVEDHTFQFIVYRQVKEVMMKVFLDHLKYNHN